MCVTHTPSRVGEYSPNGLLRPWPLVPSGQRSGWVLLRASGSNDSAKRCWRVSVALAASFGFAVIGRPRG
jgi:hypothetical protein